MTQPVTAEPRKYTDESPNAYTLSDYLVPAADILADYTEEAAETAIDPLSRYVTIRTGLNPEALGDVAAVMVWLSGQSDTAASARALATAMDTARKCLDTAKENYTAVSATAAAMVLGSTGMSGDVEVPTMQSLLAWIGDAMEVDSES